MDPREELQAADCEDESSPVIKGATRRVRQTTPGRSECTWSLSFPELGGERYTVKATVARACSCSVATDRTIEVCVNEGQPFTVLLGRVSGCYPACCTWPGNERCWTRSQDGHQFDLCVDCTSLTWLPRSLVLFVDGGEALSRLPARVFWARRFSKSLAAALVLCVLVAAVIALGVYVALPILAMLVLLAPVTLRQLAISIAGLWIYGFEQETKARRAGYSSVALTDTSPVTECPSDSTQYGLV